MAYTAEEIKELTTVDWWPLRACGICGAQVGYLLNREEDLVSWDGSCDCSSYETPLRRASWQIVADTINRQPERLQQMMITELRGDVSGRQL